MITLIPVVIESIEFGQETKEEPILIKGLLGAWVRGWKLRIERDRAVAFAHVQGHALEPAQAAGVVEELAAVPSTIAADEGCVAKQGFASRRREQIHSGHSGRVGRRNKSWNVVELPPKANLLGHGFFDQAFLTGTEFLWQFTTNFAS